MFLLNKLRQFGEYNDMVDAVNTYRGNQVAIVDSMSQAFSDNFINFAHNQPSELAQPLKTIHKQGEQAIAKQKDLFLAQTPLPQDLLSMKTHYAEISKRSQAVKAANEQLVKSKAALEAAEQQLKSARILNNPVEISKHETNVKIADAKVKSDEINLENLSKSATKESRQYKKLFIEALAGALKRNAELEEKSAQDMIVIAERMGEAAQLIKDYHDPLIPKLQEKLKNLEFEAVG